MLFFIKKYFTQGHERSVTIKRNIVFLVIYKGANLAISFFMVPLMLGYLSPSKYGVWVTLTSIIGWFAFFDIGLGNGLRNKFVESKASGDQLLTRTYVSTTYAVIFVIACLLFFFFLLINPFLHWQTILNTDELAESELSFFAMIIVFFFSARFVMDLLSTIITADQKPAGSSLIGLISNLLSFVGIAFLAHYVSSDIVLAGSVLSGIPVIVLFISSIILFSTQYRSIAPSMKFVKLKYLRSLSTLGIQFFIIQISSIVIVATSNVIISQLFGPSEVTPFNIAQRYFGLATMSFAILLTPFWSAFTEAFQKNDTAWIRNIVNKLVLIWVMLFICVVIMIIAAPVVYKIWIGPSVIIDVQINILVALSALLSSWNNIFVFFINGVGKIRMQLYIAVFIGLFNIPMAIYLGEYLHMGVPGIIIANCICLAIGAIWAPIQFKKILSGTATGLWNK